MNGDCHRARTCGNDLGSECLSLCFESRLVGLSPVSHVAADAGRGAGPALTVPLCPLVRSEERHRALLRGGQAPVPRGAEEGLRVGGLPHHPGQVHQHVRRAGRAEEHEVQREERPLRLQEVSLAAGRPRSLRRGPWGLRPQLPESLRLAVCPAQDCLSTCAQGAWRVTCASSPRVGSLVNVQNLWRRELDKECVDGGLPLGH